MDINELFERIVEAFRQYQAEITEQAHVSVNSTPTGLESETEAEKTEKIVATEKKVEQDFPKRE